MELRVKTKRKEEEEEEEEEAVSPTAEYFNSTELSVSILGVLESETPIDDIPALSLLSRVFLPITPRFSSIMVKGEKGKMKWKRVKVNLQDHIKSPTFPLNQTLQTYGQIFDDYLSKIALDPFDPTRPMWEVHIFKFPTSRSQGSIIFKLHHALGDGFSLIGALLSCLQNANDPNKPLTFPSRPLDSSPKIDDYKVAVKSVWEGVVDFGASVLRTSGLMKDEDSMIRSRNVNKEVGFPIGISTTEFSLVTVRHIKAHLGVTTNDVIAGIILLATRLYLKDMTHQQQQPKLTALVLLNTRNANGYMSVEDMLRKDTSSVWGNRFTFLEVPIPTLGGVADEGLNDPLRFVHMAHDIINRKKNSPAILLTAHLLEFIRKFRGPQVAARYIRRTLENTSMGITSLVGPLEKMSLANHPISGLYFAVIGVHESLQVTVMTYMQTVRIGVVTEEGFIDRHKFISSLQNAFDLIFHAASTHS